MDKEFDSSEIAKDVLKREQEDKRALAILLDRFIAGSGRVLVERASMGGTESFVGVVTLEWFAHRVRFADALPLFSRKLDPQTKKLIIDAETIEEIQQRPLDWSRQAPLALYLATRRPHKFPPVLVALSRDWVDRPESDDWDRGGRSLKSAADFISLDSDGKIGLLDVDDSVFLYALDGQHRLMGVQGLMDLIHGGRLISWNKDKTKQHGEPVAIEDLKDYNPSIDVADLQALSSEKIGMEFVPSVVAGETREQAKRRLRSVFVHVNRYAVRLSKGDIAQLEEDNGFTIVARRVAVHHALLVSKDDRPDRVDWHHSEIRRDKDPYLTTLQTLKSMAEEYLAHKFGHWEPKMKHLVELRPDDSELLQGYEEFMTLWDHFAELPSYKKLDQGVETKKLRAWEADGGEGHLLFRPVGQRALAAALGNLVFQEPHKSLDQLFRKISDYDKKGGFKMEDPKNPWYMVMFEPKRKRIVLAGEELASRVLEYMLGGGIPEDAVRDKLRDDLLKMRTPDPNRDQAMNFQGKYVKSEDFDLPPIL